MSARDVLDSAIHDDHLETKDVYCLGPFEGRINFLSQQYRALNVAWALAETNMVNDKTHVAVIGGGLSGITVATALLAHGARVSVYEAGTGELYRQATTRHRIVYPALNWWPKDVNSLNPTSNLPFLNWRANFCSDTISDMLSLWDELKRHYRRKLDFKSGVRFLDIVRTKENQNKIKIKYQDHKKKPDYPDTSEEKFDLVILAVGFGKERDIPDIELIEYWKEDSIEARIADIDAPTHWIVTGFGDGGAIDALRLAYKFGFGALAYELALSLHGTAVETELAGIIDKGGAEVESGYNDLAMKILKAAELQKAAEQNLSVSRSALKAARGQREREAAERNVAADQDQVRYYKALRPTQKRVAETLVNKIGFISMIDVKYDSPLKGKAAPIYKLMLAIALATGVIQARQGELRVAAGPDGPEFRIVDSGGNLVEGSYLKAKTGTVVRNGADYTFEKYATGPAIVAMMSDARRRQDHNFGPRWPEGYIYPSFTDRKVITDRLRMETVRRGREALLKLDQDAVLVPRENAFELLNYQGRYFPKHILGLPVSRGELIANMPSFKPDGIG